MKGAISMTEPAGLPLVSRGRAVTYWLATGFIAAEFALGGVWDLLQISYVRTVLAHLGYPSYFATFMGIWKVPGSVVLVVPRLPRLKEWVYAGMVYEMTGALFSHLNVGDGARAAAIPLVILGLIALSWALRPPDRRDFGHPASPSPSK